MKDLLKVGCLVLAAIFISSCSVRYGPRIPGFQPGYEEEKLGRDTFHVRIGEAWPKDWQNLEKFALYRAAEKTTENGKVYFAVLSASSQVTSYATPTVSRSTGSATVVGQTAYINTTTVTSGGGGIQGGWYYLDFKMIEEKDAPSYKTVIDARTIKEDLKDFINQRR